MPSLETSENDGCLLEGGTGAARLRISLTAFGWGARNSITPSKAAASPLSVAAATRGRSSSLAMSGTQIGQPAATIRPGTPTPGASIASAVARTNLSYRTGSSTCQIPLEVAVPLAGSILKMCPTGQPVNSHTRSSTSCIAPSASVAKRAIEAPAVSTCAIADGSVGMRPPPVPPPAASAMPPPGCPALCCALSHHKVLRGRVEDRTRRRQPG
jgi:hypothetical protein